MCDQANHNNCEIIDDLHLTITNLEMTIADLEAQIDKLAKYILEYFSGSIVNEGACLTAIGIMEELRTK